MSEAEKVISLRGTPVTRGVPNPDLVASLERLLERARSGDIIGAVYAILHDDGCGAYGMAGATPNRSVIGSLRCVEAEAVAACLRAD